MATENYKDIFTATALKKLFPEDRADMFFDALLGDVKEGAFDINLEFKKHNAKKLVFEFHLKERPGKCLACNLTYGLPEVFSRHPVINVKGVVTKIQEALGERAKCLDWRLGPTQEISHQIHVIPLTINLDK
ncbi:MAG: pancreas/duodenum homeobox protein 1 [Deltaproteobacteria bacterium]|nr:pancreas/duodenum homeobox protein 1 [Deltaproteobacteria bacterium]